MFPRVLDSEQEEIEVTFNSCVFMTVICHKDLWQQLMDGAKNARPSADPNYVEFPLQIADPTKQRINWGYNADQTDHGFLTIDLIPAPAPAPNA